MDKDILHNISQEAYTISAFIVGMILIGDLDNYEQNALGNWFMLVAQVLCTNGNVGHVSNRNSKVNTKSILKKAVNAINEELNQLKS